MNRILQALPLVLSFAIPALAADILLVTGDSNGTTPRDSLCVGDRFLKTRLETVLGHAVTVRWDTATGNSLRASALASDLVIVSESVTSPNLTNKLKSVAVPILNYEAFIQDDLGLTPSGPAGDPGPPSQFALGVVENRTRLLIRNPAHALAQGLSDTVTVYSAARSLTWGKVGAGAVVIASLADDTAGAVIYAYAKGSTLFDGSTAAGLRLGFFLEDDNELGTPNVMTADGLKLFDGAVAYALASTTVSLRPGVPLRKKSFAPFSLRGRDFRGRAMPAAGNLEAPAR